MGSDPSLPRLLVTGASGFLGWNICRRAAETYKVYGVYHRHRIAIKRAVTVKCDLTSGESLEKLFFEINPQLVIHAAAEADPNFCEKFPERSDMVNIAASVSIARLCSQYGIQCIFTSSDLVFDGTSPPYREQDPVTPLNRYGRQKARAERLMLEAHSRTTVCRMPLMYGDAPPGAKSFIHPMITALRDGSPLTLFSDEYRTPLGAADAAEGLLLAARKMEGGILHLGGPQRLSRYDIGVLLAEALDVRPVLRAALQKEFEMPAPRAADVSLDSSRAYALSFNPGTMSDRLRKLDCIR
jgi:dTDP-4-dehydrorhamnose reductase